MFTLLWLMLVTGSLIYNRKHLPQDYKDSKFLRSNLRLKHFGIGFISVASVMIVATLLFTYVPILRFGWLTWLATQGAETQVGETVESSSYMWFFTIVMLLVFAIFLPKLAYLEEEIFRKPTLWESTSARALQSLKFGLIHLTMGIPIAAALALSVGGAIFSATATKTAHKTLKPLQESVSYLDFDAKQKHNITDESLITVAEEKAITESTLVHTAHNYIIVTILIISSIAMIVST